jgi:hypothetical protein
MGQRAGLHALLCEVLASFGVWLWDPLNFVTDDIQTAIEREAKRHVYYQPPVNIQIAYPCIVYSISNIDTKFADNIPYMRQKRYDLTVIDKDPDSMIVDKVGCLPRCSFDRMFVSDNLYHWTFSIYY